LRLAQGSSRPLWCNLLPGRTLPLLCSLPSCHVWFLKKQKQPRMEPRIDTNDERRPTSPNDRAQSKWPPSSRRLMDASLRERLLRKLRKEVNAALFLANEFTGNWNGGISTSSLSRRRQSMALGNCCSAECTPPNQRRLDRSGHGKTFHFPSPLHGEAFRVGVWPP